MLTYALDPFMSPGEIAIIIPGLPIFFEETYLDAERAAQSWVAILERTSNPPTPPEPGDNPDEDSTPSTEGPSPL